MPSSHVLDVALLCGACHPAPRLAVPEFCGCTAHNVNVLSCHATAAHCLRSKTAIEDVANRSCSLAGVSFQHAVRHPCSAAAASDAGSLQALYNSRLPSLGALFGGTMNQGVPATSTCCSPPGWSLALPLQSSCRCCCASTVAIMSGPHVSRHCLLRQLSVGLSACSNWLSEPL